MANVIRLKRRASGGASGAPAALKTTEAAYNEVDGILYIGYGDDGGGNATSIRSIAGEGAVVMLTGAQTVAGVKTFSSFPISPSAAPTTDYQVANKKYVDDNDNIAAKINAAASKNPPVDADEFGITDSAASFALKKLTWANLKATLKTYYDTLYEAAGAVAAHAGSTATHGATGAVVGTTNTQTLTNKTLTSPVVNSPTGIVKADVGLANVDNTSDANKPVSTAQQTALNLKANLAGPTFTGSVNAPTPSVGDSSTLVATTAFVGTAVDNARVGLDAKASVRAATTGNITLSGAQTIDGVSVIATNRVLVKDQTTASENGIWVAAAGAWARAADADVSAEVTSGMFTFVEEGTVNGDTGWVLSTNDAIVLGTTALAFVQFSGAGQLTAGNGLTKTGNTIDAVGTANRITVAADAIDISGSYVGQTSITTLGTIATGTWQAAAIGGVYGGTGIDITSLAANAILKRNGSAVGAATAGTDYLNDSSTVNGGTF